MRKRLLAALAVALMAVGVVAVTAAPASAAPAPAPTFHVITGVTPNSFAQCPSGVGCVWQDYDGGGARVDLPCSVYCNHCVTFTGSWVNTISSAETLYGSNKGITWYTGGTCSGDSVHQPALTTVNFCKVCIPPWNDNIESFRID